MIHKVMRQRRRIAFAMLMSLLASVLMWPSAVTAGIVAISVLVAATLVITCAHHLRQSVECGAVGLLAAALMPPLLMVPMFVAVAVLTYGLVYTPVLDRLPIRIGLRSRKRFTAPYNRRTTWEKVVPGQGHVAAYWTGNMISAKADADDPNTLYLMFKDNDRLIEEVTLTYLSLNPHFAASYLIERDTQVAGEEIVMCYKFAKKRGERTTIVSDMRVSGLPIRLAAQRFLDDVLGDELDSFAAMVGCHRVWRFRKAEEISLVAEMGTSGKSELGVIPPPAWLADDFDTDGANDFIDVDDAEDDDNQAAA